MGRAHILALPLPAQGHINPLMHFSVLASQHGIKVSFLNTDFIHKVVINALTDGSSTPTSSGISLLSVPDGLNDDERNDVGKGCDLLLATMPRKVEELIHKLEGDDGITCIVADGHMSWVREIGMKLGIQVAMFWPASTALFSFESTIDNLIHDGFIDTDGFPTRKGLIQISLSMPSVDLANLPWSIGDTNEAKKSVFKYIKKIIEESKLIAWKLVNSTLELEPAAFSLSNTFLPIGPLMANYDTGSSGSQFWREDSSYIEWLDQQQPMSVIYVSFGSTTELSQKQIQEILLGLELTNKPFLWVNRPGLTSGTHQDVQSNIGKIVCWVSQQKVLQHPAIACFVSHCGWNSTIEGLSNGVPFLCWPYLGDQFLNMDYICDIWKVGLGLQIDEYGVVRKEEVKDKVDKLLGDDTIKARSLKLQHLVRESIEENGQSSRNLNDFFKWLKH